MRMLWIINISACLCLLSMGGCSQTSSDPLVNIPDLQIKTAYNPETAFPDKAVYRFMRLEPARERYNSEMQKLFTRIRDAIQEQLESKGYQYGSDKGQIRFVIDYQVIGQQSRDVVAQRVTSDGRQWLQPSGLGPEFVEGSLIIDVIDVQTLKPVWRGVSNLKIQADSASDKLKDQRITYIVFKMLENFPPDS